MMKFSREEISSLRREMEKRLSKKRFIHTLGVEEMAAFIGEKILPDMIDELSIAALLHDVSKEYSEAEHLFVAKKHNITLTEEDISSPAVWHSVTGPLVIKDDFPEYAAERVLSAVAAHTSGAADMTPFDEIIFLSDYIEKGRTYQSCISLRESFLNELSSAACRDEGLRALHRAVLISLDNTISELTRRGKSVHPNALKARESILIKQKGNFNGNN